MADPRRIKKRKQNLKSGESVIQMSGGVYVLCQRVPAWLLEAFESSHQEPKPPTVEQSIVGGGTEDVENFDDPDYIVSLGDFERKRGSELALLVFDHTQTLPGTVVQETEWVTKLERWGIEDTNENRLKCFALASAEQDTNYLVREVMRLSTVTEEEVTRAAEGFQPEVDGSAGGSTSPAEEQPDV